MKRRRAWGLAQLLPCLKASRFYSYMVHPKSNLLDVLRSTSADQTL
jgi:hypothetical protein